MKNSALLLLFFLMLFSCEKKPAYKESLIEVDSLIIIHSATLVYSTMFEINLYGTISSDGCSSFSHFNIIRQGQDLIIEAWKKVQVNATACPAVMVYLNEKIFYDSDNLPENFTIKIKQPDGSYLEKPMSRLDKSPALHQK